MWYSYTCFSTYINIMVTLVLIYDSLIWFYFAIKVFPVIYGYILFSLVTWPKMKHFNLMDQLNVNYPYTGVFNFYFHNRLSKETKLNKCNQIEVLLQRDFRFKFFIYTVFRHIYGFLSSYVQRGSKLMAWYYLPYLLQDQYQIILVIFNSLSWNKRCGHIIYLVARN